MAPRHRARRWRCLRREGAASARDRSCDVRSSGRRSAIDGRVRAAIPPIDLARRTSHGPRVHADVEDPLRRVRRAPRPVGVFGVERERHPHGCRITHVWSPWTHGSRRRAARPRRAESLHARSCGGTMDTDEDRRRSSGPIASPGQAAGLFVSVIRKTEAPASAAPSPTPVQGDGFGLGGDHAWRRGSGPRVPRARDGTGRSGGPRWACRRPP